MTSCPHPRACKLRFHAGAILLLAILGAPLLVSAQAPVAPPAPQPQPVADSSKKDSQPSSTPAAAAKPAAPKPHRVFTNEDISSGPSVPVASGARLRLKQLNRCDRACFIAVEKQALSFGYQSVYPRATRQQMEDSLANYIEQLHADPTWQQLLLNMISTHISYCTDSQQAASRPENSPSHVPTREEIQAQEESMRNYRQPAPGTYSSAGSAVMNYRWSSKPDPLKASFMVYQYLDEAKRDCSVIAPSQDDPDDPDDP